jgi:hypothetical protein
MQDELVSLLLLRAPDGSEVVVSVTRSEAGLARAQEVVMSTELLPGEDPELLRGPARIEVYEVRETHASAGDGMTSARTAHRTVTDVGLDLETPQDETPRSQPSQAQP